MDDTVNTAALERSAMFKVYLRLLPFTVIAYFLAYVDRINVSFAALTMNKDIGLSAAAFGFSGTLFYIGYVLFEVPSNIAMEKIGARIWIARIMISWGVISGATAFVATEFWFDTVRLLLGIAEAGFFPGMMLLFTYWFPEHHRARIIAGFTVALPLAIGIGAPISTAIMELNGLFGLKSWQLVFVFEALPTVLLGIATLFFLTDRPADARWLSDAERHWLMTELANERRQKEARRSFSLWQMMRNPQVLWMSLNYFGIVTASLGMAMFIPQIIKQLGFSNMNVGWLTMIPYLIGAASMIFFGWSSDRMQERRWHLTIASLLAGGGMLIAGLAMGSIWGLIGMSIAAAGLYGSKGPFFAMPSMFLSGMALAAGLGWINALGNIGGAVGPLLVGWAKDATGSFATGLYLLAGFGMLSAIVAGFFIDVPRVVVRGQRAPAE